MKNGILCAALMIGMAAPIGGEAAGERPRVTMQTTEGDITLALYLSEAPETVKNFLTYVDAEFYDGTIFHRVIPGFMIQGGGLLPDMDRKPARPPIGNEADNGRKNTRGTIAMARTSDPHSATCQFFINTVDNDFLNHKNKSTSGWGYAVFGEVVEGMDVVDAIAGVKTTSRSGFKDVPEKAVLIQRIRRLPQ